MLFMIVCVVMLEKLKTSVTKIFAGLNSLRNSKQNQLKNTNFAVKTNRVMIRQKLTKKTFQKEILEIKEGNWLELQVEEYIQKNNINQWKVKILDLNWNGYHLILKAISHINFRDIKHLFLNGNRIISIQGLCKINLTSIQKLTLIGNQICNVSELKKVNWNSFVNLWCNNNTILNAEHLIYIPTKKFKFLCLEFEFDFSQCQNIRWLTKLQSQVFSELKISSSQRIQQGKFYPILRKKYKNIKIKKYDYF